VVTPHDPGRDAAPGFLYGTARVSAPRGGRGPEVFSGPLSISRWPVSRGCVGRKRYEGGPYEKGDRVGVRVAGRRHQDPGGAGEYDRGGWAFLADRGPEGDKFDELAAADALLLGCVTYEGFAAAWPQLEEQTGEYGAWMNGYPKHVASRTLEEPLEWNNSTLIKGEIAEEVSRHKQQDGKDILVFGSGELVRTLMEHDLIDEYRLMVLPIVVGKGKRLFGDTEETKPMKLVDTKPVGPDGVIIRTYESAGQRVDG
jgi:dihydrofolate reductase